MKTLPMTIYKQGDVLLVPFPFTNQLDSKQRPAVVISGMTYNEAYPDLILAPITSQLARVVDEVVLNDWQQSGLLKPSAVKPILASFEQGLVKKHLGTLSEADLDEVRALFARILNLNP